MDHLSIIGSDRIAAVGEAFSECDSDMLLDVILDCEAGWNIPFRELGNSARSVLSRRVISTLNLMRLIYGRSTACKMVPEDPLTRFTEEAFAYSASDLSMQERVASDLEEDLLVPWESFEVIGANGEFMRTISARILHAGALEQAKDVIRVVGGRLCSCSEMAQAARLLERSGAQGPLDSIIATGLISPVDNLIGEAWSTTLNRHIWLPADLCLRELYGVLANIFWAMTYTGFPESDLDPTSPSPSCSSSLDPIPPSFYADYEAKIDHLVDMLNFNCWVEAVEQISHLRNAA